MSQSIIYIDTDMSVSYMWVLVLSLKIAVSNLSTKNIGKDVLF